MTRRHSLGSNMASLWFQAPLVIGLRCQAMALSAFSGRAQDTAEMNRMVLEKASASLESATAFNIALMQQGMTMFQGMMRGQKPAFKSRHGERLAAAAVRPYAKRVRANSKRLTRKAPSL